MVADVSLVYLSTVSTILYFSSCFSSSYPDLRRSTTVASLSLYLRRLNRPPTGLIALFACFPVPATEGCHTGLMRCICLSRSLLPLPYPIAPELGGSEPLWYSDSRRVPQKKNPSRNQFRITQCVKHLRRI